MIQVDCRERVVLYCGAVKQMRGGGGVVSSRGVVEPERRSGTGFEG